MNTFVRNICPITYEPLLTNEKYSKKGLKLLSPSLLTLNDLPFSAAQLRKEAKEHANKLSIQGVQLKLSARINPSIQSFEICDIGGKFILKPPSEIYSELPENEDLSMRLAAELIEIPLHGLIRNNDNSFTYFIKRFDRIVHNQKLPVEDFGQLAKLKSETKYDFSMEKIIPIIDQYCTFPSIEKIKFLTRLIFNYLIGNEDMHLKNFSLITRNGKIELSPGYDFINTTIAIGNAKEEIALPINGKKNNLRKKDIIEYYGMKKLGLNESTINEILEQFKTVIPKWQNMIEISFLSEQGKRDYLSVLEKRMKVLDL